MKISTQLTIDSIVQRNPKLLANQLDGEIVMMSIDNSEYYGLDETGSRIWELIEVPVSISSLIETLITEFEVSKGECLQDTIEFLNDLLEKDLLIVIDGPHS